MLLRHRRADRPTETPMTPAACREGVGAIGTRGIVDRVFEHAGNRAIIFRRHEQNALGRDDLAFQPLHRCGLVRVVVLIVERKIADLRLVEGKLRRRSFASAFASLRL